MCIRDRSEQRSRSDLTSALSQSLLNFKKTIFRDIKHYISTHYNITSVHITYYTVNITQYTLHITYYILHMPLIRFYVFAHYELGVHTTQRSMTRFTFADKAMQVNASRHGGLISPSKRSVWSRVKGKRRSSERECSNTRLFTIKKVLSCHILKRWLRNMKTHEDYFNYLLSDIKKRTHCVIFWKFKYPRYEIV